ncbi:MAG: biotin--[acetyl-CoA-carboxylase] ligase [Candidatus Accumulibacter sp.]|jgi:BirA family biotin operon repressor/biotin-[acetyl-CoA-carboxylase] ligase|nr:biotin--[acetyl-CoA-carboxylase] ligase [Accumulibacter sp.]
MSDAPSLLIDPARVNALLEGDEVGGRFEIVAVAECSSTNLVLMERAEDAPSGTVLVADRQTAGRGSRGRTWVASPEASLTFSVLWAFPGGLERLSGLSLAVGVAVVRALARCGVGGVMLKWPNDILYGEAKLGGILIELKAGGGSARAVVGIGLNLRLPENIGESGIAALPPTALARIVAAPPDRNVLLARLLAELARVFERFAADGFAGLREAWHACHAWQGRPVRLLRDGRVEREGICAGADADGALLVRTADGLERCLSGDVSLRSS